ncbi:hypothetical protein, partial [Mycobacterium avium]|uniref:hypothetical protein n=1 Tax=Mycobacterium avium TaxID=1764 RepID=UPI004032F805
APTGGGAALGSFGAGAAGGAVAVLGGTGVGTSGSACEVAGNAMATALAPLTVVIASVVHSPLRRVEVGST